MVVLWTINALTRDLIIDVRRYKEFVEKHILEAVNLDHEAIGTEIDKLHQAKDQKIVRYYRTGRRSGLAQDTQKNAVLLKWKTTAVSIMPSHI
ncbi:rhodanese-like domain-containing protein [Undibacterium sp.]|uniref:rhodanese-like domain-containing protein n=1 Tax=Undibacterium sp. TaxID=1914977 RepID=UPI003750C11B